MIETRLTTRAKWAGIFDHYWRWWIGELRDIIPSRFRDAARARNRLHIYLHEDRLAIESVVAGSGRRFLSEQSLNKIDNDTWSQIADLCGKQEPYILLQRHDHYLANFDLPRTARSYLRQATSLQIDLLSPLNPDLIEWAVVENNVFGKTVTATLILAKKSRLDEIENSFREHNIALSAMAVQLGDGLVVLRRFNDTPPEGPLLLQPRNIYRLAFLILLLTPLTIGFLAKIMLVANNADIARMEQELSAKAAGDRMANQYESDRQTVAAISQIPSLGLQLETISHALPEGNFIETVSADPSGQLLLEASGPDGTKTTEGLTASALFREVSLTIEPDSNDGSNSYTIEARVK